MTVINIVYAFFLSSKTGDAANQSVFYVICFLE